MEELYYSELKQCKLQPKTKFLYAKVLVRSIYPADIKKGLILLQELLNNRPDKPETVLFNMAIGNTRLKRNTIALKYVQCCQALDSDNDSFANLETFIRARLQEECLFGLSLMSGVLIFCVTTFLVAKYTMLKH